MDKAVCYIRVSTEEQAREGVSLEAQEERLRAYCKMGGLEIVEMIREEGVSATKPLRERPGGEILTRLINTGKANSVVALKLDRLFRNAEDALQQTREWDKKGVTLHLVDMGGQALNTQSAMGRFFSMLWLVCRIRTQFNSGENCNGFKPQKEPEAYSPTPLGFERIEDTLRKDKGEWEIVDYIFQLREEGLSYWKIAEDLNNRGIPGKRGGKWYAGTVRYIIQNDLYEEVAECC